MDELIKALRKCGKASADRCWSCDYYDREPWCESALANDAADALETSEKNRMYLFDRVCELEEDNSELKELVPKWISVNERLPEESGGYIAYIQEPHMIQKADWEEQYDFSFAMQLWFDKQKMLWSDNGEDSYNAYLPVVDTDNAFHVTHWMKLPEPPKGE